MYNARTARLVDLIQRCLRHQIVTASVLRAPDIQLLPEYLDALRKGWTPESDHDSMRAQRLIERVESAPETFIASLSNPTAQGAPIVLDSGAAVPRLATLRFWIFDGTYCGDLNLRWQLGTSELPEYCDGHVGYAVVPWKRRRGLATAALSELSAKAPAFGLQWLDIAMSAENLASRKVAVAAGAKLCGEYVATEQGGVHACRYRIACTDA